MRTPLDMYVVGRLGNEAQTPQELRAHAAQLVAWSRERHPEDAADVTPAGEASHAICMRCR